MGRELVCCVRVNGEGADAKTLLETDSVIVRSPHRITVPFRATESVEVDGPTLILRTAHDTVELELGEEQAAAWAHRIRNPKSRLDKLGVKAGQRVGLVGTIADDDFEAELAERGVDVTVGRVKAGSDVILFGAQRTRDLDRLPRLRAALAPDGALWVIRPKGGVGITEAEVMERGKGAGLVDTKVVKFSETLTAEKFVVPVAARR